MSKSKFAKALCSMVLALPLAAAAQSSADKYPSRPVTVIIPFVPGGPIENDGRIFTTKLTEMYGQSFVFDFKPGAGNRIGTDALIRAAPDGHTLMFTASTLSTIPLMFSLPYDLYKVVAPVSLVSKKYVVLAASPSVPYRNMTEYVAYAKLNPRKINIATAGVGGSLHLTNLWMDAITGTETTSVHYKGAVPIITDLLGDRLDLFFGNLQIMLPYLKAGKLRAIALANLQRNPVLPDLPTVAEGGYPGFEYSSWLGLLAPAGTPAAIRNKLAADISKVTKLPDVVKRLGTESQLVGSTPDEFEQLYLQENERWKKLVKEANIKFE
jgi:tripartite-type tricarboxylate transporter receptor subunit TctC